MNQLYKQEILELTYLLRNDEDWRDLRNTLLEQELKLKEIVLVYFMEDEKENEYGVIVTKNRRIIEYTRSTLDGPNNINYFKSKDITKLKEEINKYPQIATAFEIIDDGGI